MLPAVSMSAMPSVRRCYARSDAYREMKEGQKLVW
jgi:hypothetical protein